MSNTEITINNETKICNKCGRKLPMDKFDLMKGKSGKPYRLNTCKDCRYKYKRERIEKKKEVNLSDDINILVKKSYKKIHSERILDLSKTDIYSISEDEIFVKLMDYKNAWLSNYGRVIRKSDNKLYLLQGDYDSNGSLRYTLKKNVLCDGKWIYKRTVLYAAQAVIREFIVNPDTVNNVFIWHKGNDKNDNCYRNLYPLNKDQYYALRRHYNKNRDDSEETILKIMNDIRYKPDNWSEKSMEPTMCGVGFRGREDVDCTSKEYLRWHDMIHRCYNAKFHERQQQYKECSVCEEWLNFCNFEKWYNENYFEIDDEIMDLDKDIIFKGNKEYSHDACCIVPHCINTLFLNGKKNRGDLPLGIHYDRDKGKYRACMSYKCIPIKIGTFNTAEDAFMRYKIYKEDFIKDIAEQYKGEIPDKVYKAMLNWKIEIDD